MKSILKVLSRIFSRRPAIVEPRILRDLPVVEIPAMCASAKHLGEIIVEREILGRPLDRKDEIDIYSDDEFGPVRVIVICYTRREPGPWEGNITGLSMSVYAIFDRSGKAVKLMHATGKDFDSVCFAKGRPLPVSGGRRAFVRYQNTPYCEVWQDEGERIRVKIGMSLIEHSPHWGEKSQKIDDRVWGEVVWAPEGVLSV